MKEKSFLILCAAATLFAPGASAEPRPALTGVSSIRIANYGSPSALVGRDELRPVVEEINRTRRKDWRRGDVKMTCYSTVVLFQGTKRVGEFRVRPDLVVERPVEKGQTSYNLALDGAELPRLAKVLSGILPAKDCDAAK